MTSFEFDGDFIADLKRRVAEAKANGAQTIATLTRAERQRLYDLGPFSLSAENRFFRIPLHTINEHIADAERTLLRRITENLTK